MDPGAPGSACAAAVRYSQAKTLMVLVQAAVHCPRMSLANLGRSMSSDAYVKHRIKRAWRFIAASSPTAGSRPRRRMSTRSATAPKSRAIRCPM
jgi:hypothetical protein